MIISASRRTDIPTYYSAWFFNRLREGYVLVRNPLNIHQVSKISLDPDVIDGIVFWTKNPIPMLDKLDWLKDYVYYFQFTLTSYGKDVETGIPSKKDVIIPAFQRLSDAIGPDRVIWRYDPIFLSETYTMDYHIRYFEEIARKLSPYTRKCTISFIDMYRKTQKNVAGLSMREFPVQLQDELAGKLAEIAHSYGLDIETCSEGIDLEKYGIHHARCIDDRLFAKLIGCSLNAGKDKNQRAECGCIESIDIGAYNTCKNGCLYCYANYSNAAVITNAGKHDPNSPLLFGSLGPEDMVSEKKMVSYKDYQISLEI